jgi:hypothetical protein
MGRPRMMWEDQVKLGWGMEEHTEWEDLGGQSKSEQVLFGDSL